LRAKELKEVLGTTGSEPPPPHAENKIAVKK
jgi:hypothetical protein